jgi:hypothetical protein
MDQRFRNIVFTVNNYTESEYTDLPMNDAFIYVIFGKEIGEQATPHLQGYSEFKNS